MTAPGTGGPAEDAQMRRLVVMHAYFDCDTGCCGHVIHLDGQQIGQFLWSHPYSEDARRWAEDLIREEMGDEHVKDLDWDNSFVSED